MNKNIQLVILTVILSIAVACFVAVIVATKTDEEAGKSYQQLAAENA